MDSTISTSSRQANTSETTQGGGAQGSSALRTSLIAGFISLAVSLLVVMGASVKPATPPPAPEAATEQPSVPVTGAVTEEEHVKAAVKKADPAVVSVIIAKDLPVVEQYFESPFGSDDPFGQFFPGFGIPRERVKGTEHKEVGGGTAFFIGSDGLLMTNKHVAEDEEAEYTVLLNDGRKLPAKVVARDPGNDIALLKVEGSNFPALAFSDAEPTLGQTVIAIGNALGEFRNTVSKGVVSGLSRTITAGSGQGDTERLESIIQTDAAINRGNSGGPLLDIDGRVIGMNTAIAAGAQNIGFAIPVADLKRALGSYKEHGKIVRPYLGIRYMPITKELKEKNSLPYDYGVLVVRGEQPTDLAVIPGSPADKAGLQENDIILEADGKKLTGDVSLAAIVQRKSPGDRLTLKVFEKEQEKEVTVTLEERK